MKIIKGIDRIPSELKNAVVTIGNFDGIHLGHRLIFEQVIAEARSQKVKAVVISFDPHPKMLLHPERKPFYLITSLEEKIRLLDEIGIDALILIPFSLEFSKTTAEAFVGGILWEKLHIRKIFIGHDYTFGRGKEGNEAFLVQQGKKLGFDVDVINAFTINGGIVSSTRIRNAILDGDVKTADAMLGRPYNLSGPVVEGHRRGAGLGFPTANIDPEKVLVPARGVYAVLAEVDGKRYQGVLNIGYNPTFADEKRSVEVHLLDFEGDLYGKTLEVLFVERIRDEVKFDGPDKLVAQIRQDIDKARIILKPFLS
ncbi:MAG: bifunctional riboflavin kinase/FAD synthetase [Deltaproteobacteria bacterium]|nr:bifunctional riboflavin kinase/FAD synthetase [Deltaproteobacteria bacterium]